MYEVQVVVVGWVATQVGVRMSAAGIPVARFRLASTVRRFDQEQRAWSDAYTSFYTVWAWRSLAANVSSSVGIGDPVLVQGQLRVREPAGPAGSAGEEERRQVSADLLASAIGHDLSRGTSAFVRTSRAGAGRSAAGAAEASPEGASPDGASPGIREPVVPRQPPRRESPDRRIP